MEFKEQLYINVVSAFTSSVNIFNW